MHSNESNKGESYQNMSFLDKKKKNEYIENIHKMHKENEVYAEKNGVGFSLKHFHSEIAIKQSKKWQVIHWIKHEMLT